MEQWEQNRKQGFSSAIEEIQYRLFQDVLIEKATIEIYCRKYPELFDYFLGSDKRGTSDQDSQQIELSYFIRNELALTYLYRPEEFHAFQEAVTERYVSLTRELGQISTLQSIYGDLSPEAEALLKQFDDIQEQPPDEDSGWVERSPAPA